MIPKNPGAREVTQQHALLLFEGDFNWANKAVFADRMISRAEACGAIPDEQYVRKGHTALEVSQMRMFHCDLLRLRRWPGAIASVDANNCFDRIGHSFMSLACQAMGVGVGPLVSMLSALSYMAFYIHTGYGDSRRTILSVLLHFLGRVPRRACHLPRRSATMNPHIQYECM